MVNIRKQLIRSGLAGVLMHNSPRINERAIVEYLKGTLYWTLGIEPAKMPNISHDEARIILAESLGISERKFRHGRHAYISPDATQCQIGVALSYLKKEASQGKALLLATGHPGSMLGLYEVLAGQYRAWGGQIYTEPRPRQIMGNTWLDWVGDCMVVTDEGSLLHSHADNGGLKLMKNGKIDLVVADHGFAAAAINADLPVVAFFDTDDPAIPLAAAALPNIIAVPLNDNQKNNTTAAGFASVIGRA